MDSNGLPSLCSTKPMFRRLLRPLSVKNSKFAYSTVTGNHSSPTAPHEAHASSSRSSASTKETLRGLATETSLFATVELKNRPYQVSKNDIIITPRMNDLKLGDVISFDRVREIGSKDWILRGNPFILPEYFSIKAVCIEHNRAAPITRKHWKKSGATKSVTNQSSHTLLRISEMSLKTLDG
jgi:ribosomal protein L21